MRATANDKAATHQLGYAPQRKSRWLSARNVVIAVLAIASAALYFGWQSLVAAGVATVILGVLPCLAMCALGICAARMGRKDGGETQAAVPPNDATRKETP